MQTASSDPLLSLSNRGSYVATVISNDPVCREHFWMKLHVPGFGESVPGQFVQLQGGPEAEAEREIDWSPGHIIDAPESLAREALLNRPFSIAAREDDFPDGTRPLVIIYRVVGAGTEWLAKRPVHSTIRLIGPVGNPFRPPPEGSTALLVGGGVGIPPMLYCAQQFQAGPRIAFCGVMSKDLLPLAVLSSPDDKGLEPRMSLAQFAATKTPSIVTSDDGSIGRKGFVTDALRDWLASHRETASIYTCGPEPMLKAVAQIAAEFSVPCQVAVERAMACGLGTCQSCVIRVRQGDAWKYKLSCTDGPVFDASTLAW